jgi:hypothetical protein
LSAFDRESRDNAAVLHGGEVVKVSEGSEQSSEYVPTILYEIRYNDQQARKTLDRLKPILDKIKNKKALLGKTGQGVDRIVRLIVSHILYLYKDFQYATEKEARVVADFDISAEFLKLDERKPPRVFVESIDFLFGSPGSRIILGPKVPDKAVVELSLKYRLARNGLLSTTSIVRSKAPYR